MNDDTIRLVLNAVICAIRDGSPVIYTVPNGTGEPALPAGPLEPARDRTLEAGLRRWIAEQTDLRPGYVEQLYTFGDSGREGGEGRVVSVGYLGLARAEPGAPRWCDVYDLFPWEDWRGGRPAILDEIGTGLEDWAAAEPKRTARVQLAFGSRRLEWNEERVLERYELLYEAGMVAEAALAGRPARGEGHGRPLAADHRRILATALARLRAKMKYRPVVFELLPATFTLRTLQDTAEAIHGRSVHKQNFRRMVETAQLVEPTGDTAQGGTGRPAKLYRFRTAVMRERPAPGLRVA